MVLQYIATSRCFRVTYRVCKELTNEFIIEDHKKNYYYRGLAEWRNEKGLLIDTCLDGQDAFVSILDMLDTHI